MKIKEIFSASNTDVCDKSITEVFSKKRLLFKNIIHFIILLTIFVINIGVQAEEKVKSSIPARKVRLIKRITGKEEGAPRNLGNPFCLHVDAERSILLITAGPGGPIYRFDIADNFKFIDVFADSKELYLSAILDINVDKNGNIYILDTILNKIYLFDSQGVLKQTIIPRESRSRKDAISCVGVAFSSKGDIYVADKSGSGIQVLDWEGNYLYQIKRARLEQLDFGFPSIAGARINSQDEIYLFDNLLSRIIKFNLKGKTLAVFGGRGDVAGKFVDATGIGIDNKDRIYVVESMTGTTQVFDKDGNFLHILADENGERLQLLGPEKISFDNKGNIFILERMKNRASVFKFID